MTRTLDTVKAEMQEQIALMNKAQRDGDLKALTDAESNIKKLEKEYTRMVVHHEYDVFNATDEPFKSAVIKRTYKTLRHIAKTSEDGAITTYELGEKSRTFDLLDLCDTLKIDTTWQYTLESINLLFTKKTAKELGYSKSDVEKIPQTYAMQKKAREIASKGGDITSNAQCKKILQELIDDMPTPVDDEGNKMWKVNSYDVNYIINCYCKKGKNDLSVATAKKGFLLTLIADVLYRIATNGKYTVEYKSVKA